MPYLPLLLVTLQSLPLFAFPLAELVAKAEA